MPKAASSQCGVNHPANDALWQLICAEAATIEGVPLTDDERRVFSYAVKNTASTRASYIALLRKMDTQGFTLDAYGYSDYLGLKRDKPLSRGVVYNTKAAINFINSAGKTVLSSADTRYMNGVADGYIKTNPQDAKDRGSLTTTQFEQLRQLIRADKDKKKSECHGYITLFMFAFGFRSAQMRGLTRNNFVKQAGKPWTYYGARMKLQVRDKIDPNNSTNVETHEVMAKYEPEVGRYLKSLDGQNQQPMFPEYSPSWVDARIKDAARKNKWGDDLKWCIHSVRHGSVTEAVKQGGEAAGQRRTGHRSLISTRRYCRDNKTRRRQDKAKTENAKRRATRNGSKTNVTSTRHKVVPTEQTTRKRIMNRK